MRDESNFVYLNHQHQSIRRYLCFVWGYDIFYLGGEWHPWKTRDPSPYLDFHHCVFRDIIGIFWAKHQYHQSCNTYQVYKNLRTIFISIFEFPNQFGNCFVSSFLTFGRTKLYLFHQLNDHKRFFELREPIN